MRHFCVTNIDLCQTYYVFCRNIFDLFGLVENDDFCEDNSKWISINIMNQLYIIPTWSENL